MAGSLRKRTWTTRKGEIKAAWQAAYFDQHGKRHARQFMTRRDADTWLTRTKGDVAAGIHTPDSNTATVAEAAELWLKHVEANGIERGSLRAYEQLARLGVVPLLGPKRLSRLSRADVVMFKDELLDRFARARARRVLWALRAILTRAHDLSLVAHNVALTVRFERRAKQETKLVIGRTIPTPQEMQAMLAIVGGGRGKGGMAWLRPMVITAAFTGMREGELRALTWEDVDLANARIVVRQRADQWGTMGKPKSLAGQRVLDLQPLVVNTLRQWRQVPERHPVHVFPGRNGKVIGQSSVLLAFNTLQEAAGIIQPARDNDGQPVLDEHGQPARERKYVFHALRHFFASVEIALGRNPKQLQTAMGHEKIELTMNDYGHLFPNQADQTGAHAAAFEAFVLGPAPASPRAAVVAGAGGTATPLRHRPFRSS